MQSFCVQSQSTDILQRHQSDCEHESLYNELMEAFFSRDNIVKSMSLLMIKANICLNDSVSDMVQVLMSERMCVHFNQFGFVPFKAEPMLYIEFNQCSPSQLRLIQRILINARHSKQFVACSHMNTGATVLLQDQVYHCKLNACNVLFALYQLIQKSALIPLQKQTVFNILVQRLRNAVAVPSESLLELKRLCQLNETKARSSPARPT